MSASLLNLRRKMGSARELQTVVRTMKAYAASNIQQYEQAVTALADYAHTVEQGLGVCLRSLPVGDSWSLRPEPPGSHAIGIIVFGSDQGLVGQFNDRIADHALATLATLARRTNEHSHGREPEPEPENQQQQQQQRLSRPPWAWIVGERVRTRLDDSGLLMVGHFEVPQSIAAITSLVADILLATEARQQQGELGELHLFYNRPTPIAVYAPVTQRLLPLDTAWQSSLLVRPWPSNQLPEIIAGSGSGDTATLGRLTREHLFVSLFRACAESLASENASRLAAMQRAEKNIEQLLEAFGRRFHQRRQSAIDAELFDVIAGFEALRS